MFSKNFKHTQLPRCDSSTVSLLELHVIFKRACVKPVFLKKGKGKVLIMLIYILYINIQDTY